jgi:arsenite methyltransferase
VVSSSPLALNNAEIERKAGAIRFSSVTVRAFKLALEDRCEDYGQVAYYLGTMPEHPHQFALDDHHLFHTGRPMLVCGNTADMIEQTRYAAHFRVTGDKRVHHGLFDCGPAGATPAADGAQAGCC